MARKRPCKICGRWFKPDPRAGRRQQACSNKSCQKERHRRNCQVINRVNRDSERAHRTRQKYQKLPAGKQEGGKRRSSTPVNQVCWSAVKKAVGIEVAVLAEMNLKKHGSLGSRLSEAVSARAAMCCVTTKS